MKLFLGSPRVGRVAALAALVIMLLSVFQLTALAQEDLDETYVSGSESFQISFPSDWTVVEDENGNFITIEGSLSNREIALLVFDPNLFTDLLDGIDDLLDAGETITGSYENFSSDVELISTGNRDTVIGLLNDESEEFTGISFTVPLDSGAFGFMAIIVEIDDFNVIEENVETVFAIVESYNSAGGSEDDTSGSGSGLGGLLGGGSGGDEDDDSNSGGLGGVLGGSSGGDAEIGDTCAEFPLNVLNAYQYGIVDPESGDPLLVYNVGCDGFMTFTFNNSTTVIEYDISSDGEFSFQPAEAIYTSVSADENEWVVESSEGGTIPLQRIDDEGVCDDELAELIRGTWVVGSGAEAIIFDFTCNGIMLLTSEGETQALFYTVSGDTLVLEFDDGSELELTGLTIDGDTMEVINSSNNRLSFTNSVESE